MIINDNYVTTQMLGEEFEMFFLNTIRKVRDTLRMHCEVL